MKNSTNNTTSRCCWEPKFFWRLDSRTNQAGFPRSADAENLIRLGGKWPTSANRYNRTTHLLISLASLVNGCVYSCALNFCLFCDFLRVFFVCLLTKLSLTAGLVCLVFFTRSPSDYSYFNIYIRFVESPSFVSVILILTKLAKTLWFSLSLPLYITTVT